MTTRPRTAAHAMRHPIAALVLVITSACGSSATVTAPPPPPPGPPVVTTQFGAAIAVGDGTARSYLIEQDGVPTEIGVALSEVAANNLPMAQMAGYEYLVPLPASNPTQYQVIGLNWNPVGHLPQQVYTLPHFDVHFYMTSLADRNAINAGDPAFATKAANLPTAAFRLDGYVNDPPAVAAIPQMGLHWTDSNAPEFHGQIFTRTFITGSWDGQFTFLEPMVTLAYLQTHPDVLVATQTASNHAIAGYYPAAYRVAWVAADTGWRIALSTLSHFAR